MRRPYIQFYPGDWQANPKLKLCSHTEKGIWLDVMCILHDQDEYGVIRWTLKQLAQSVRTSVPALQRIVDKGILKGADKGESCGPMVYTPRSGRKTGKPAALIPEQQGPIWYSSRMVRDEYLRQVRERNFPAPLHGNKSAPLGRKGASPLGRNSVSKKSAPSRARAQGRGRSSSSSSSSSDQLNGIGSRSLSSRLNHPHPGGLEKTGGEKWLSEFSEADWESYIADHDGIRHHDLFLDSAATGKHDQKMRDWLQRQHGGRRSGTNSKNARKDPNDDFEFKPKSTIG